MAIDATAHSAPHDTALSAVGISKSYDRAAKGGQKALDGVSLEAAIGEMTVVVGPSGCGKSTLAYCLAGYMHPDSGDVTLDGKSVAGIAGPDRVMVFQETALWPWMRVADIVAFGPTVRGAMSRTDALNAANVLLAEFGLQDFADHYPGQLSGGMQRRVEIAQALINKPRALILDEPFRGLDVMTRELMQEHLLRAFEGRPIAGLFITAEIEEAVLLGDRILIMHPQGRGIVDEMVIDLPRPRRLDIIGSAAFERYRSDLLDRVLAAAGESADAG
jgi:NitT/TauT family transport system ATP-binding protein